MLPSLRLSSCHLPRYHLPHRPRYYHLPRYYPSCLAWRGCRPFSAERRDQSDRGRQERLCRERRGSTDRKPLDNRIRARQTREADTAREPTKVACCASLETATHLESGLNEPTLTSASCILSSAVLYPKQSATCPFSLSCLLSLYPRLERFPIGVALRGELPAARVVGVAAGLRGERLEQQAALRRIARHHP